MGAVDRGDPLHARAVLDAYRSLRRKTAPLLLAERAAAEPDAVAYRVKRLGIYQERSWAWVRDAAHRFMRGLEALGIEPGDRVAIMGDACEEWTIADLGAQAAGAITFGLYPTASQAEVEFQLADAGATVFVAEDQEYVDKVLPVLERLPKLRWIVVVDTTAMFLYEHEALRSFREVLGLGEARGAPDGAAFERAARALDPEAPAFIVYTSGTSGDPKGALVRHGRHLAATYNIVDRYPTFLERAHRTVVYLPLCHVFGRDIAVTLPLMTRLVPHYGESLEDLPATLFEVAPTALFSVPRYLQKFASQILVEMQNTSALKRKVYDAALGYGRRHVRALWDGRASFGGRLLYRLLHFLAFRPLLNKLGFDRIELALCGGAPLPRETMALWQIYGVSVAEIYGQTETAGGIITGQAPRFPRPGDVGAAPTGWEVALGVENEILVRAPDLFDGYWAGEAAGEGPLDDDGWLHTGDVGEWVDGRLRIVDRLRDIIVTSGGKTLSPTYIENALRASPFVSEAVVFGHGRKYVTALIEIDYETVAEWARANDVTYTGFTSLAENARVQAMIADEIAEANERLARVEQVKAFRILPKALDPEEEGEPVTPTRKVKRGRMYEKFGDLVDAMYAGSEQALVAEGIGDALEGAT